MSESFHNKDYSEYFSKLEKTINEPEDIKENIPESLKASKSVLRKKLIKRRRRFILSVLSVFLILVALISGIIILINKPKEKPSVLANSSISSEPKEPEVKYPFETENTLEISSNTDSKHVIVMDLSDRSVKASRAAFERAYPASTTKIMTLLVAVENITDLTDTFTMSYEITDPLYVEGATVAGFLAGEVINLKDMLYGIILPSGGDASVGVAMKIAGSEKAFVDLMNEKARQLKLKDTNFTNCTGLFNKNHYTTAADMAVILAEALKNPLCREILSTYKYTATPTVQHPEGLKFSSTLFNYMYGTEPEGADILGGKTGFVNESGYCIASFGKKDSGEEYIVVTLEASTRWPAFYDQIGLYNDYVADKREE
ncbi:MAG: D-alanyl-D-alanine carboxypeptidase [Oscillospiraceae bacterium]|nr:D-alanyl-D-alanine carboxypeptidase [Oscillospiraceae bacterium]